MPAAGFVGEDDFSCSPGTTCCCAPPASNLPLADLAALAQGQAVADNPTS
jgi:hypothetical protein